MSDTPPHVRAAAATSVVRPPARLARSIISNWAWYALVVVSGFVLPRFIDEYESQELLGIWDFSWSLAFYIGLLALGVVSAVNRYVARYTATGDGTALNAAVNSSLALLLGSSAIGLALVAVFVATLRQLLPEASPAVLRTAAWAVGLLGCSAALQLPLGTLTGIITGLGRFDLLNLIRGVRDTLMLLAMIAALLLGGGIVTLGLISLAFELGGSVAQWVCVRRIAPQVRFAPRYIHGPVAREILSFGGKTLLSEFARGGLYHMNGVLVAFFLGPAVLAVFARQRSFVMHAVRFLKQYSQAFIPVASGLHAQHDLAGLRDLLVRSCRYGFFAALPIILLLIIMGGPLVELWMGPDYVAPRVLTILALGHVLSLAQQGSLSILMGMGQHGLAGAYESAAAILSIGLALLALGPLDLGMIGGALAVAVPVTIASGILIPLDALHRVELPIGTYIRQVLPKPLLASVPFAGCLLAARLLLPGPAESLAVGCGLGGIVLALTYWRWVLTDVQRERLVRRFGPRVAAGSAS